MYKRLPVVTLFILTAALVESPSGRAQHPRKPSKHSGSPVVGEFVSTKNEPPQDQIHRQIREERYGDHLPKPLVDPGLTVDGQTETPNITFIDYTVLNNPDPPGIPASRSTAIIIGTVVNGKCSINQAHTFVYTDYQIRIDQIVKPDATSNLAVGDVITASRPGGAIHFPSGHITDVFDAGHGLPAVGSQYVLFLWKAIPNFPEYEIVIDSGYELKNGKAYPLDDANSQYEGSDANLLLAKIQGAIASKGGNQ